MNQPDSFKQTDSEFTAHLRARFRSFIEGGGTVPDALIPIIVACRPFVYFPNSYSQKDVTELEQALKPPPLVHTEADASYWKARYQELCRSIQEALAGGAPACAYEQNRALAMRVLNETHQAQRVAAMFHPDMDYSDIRVAIGQLLKLEELTRTHFAARNEYLAEDPIRECLQACKSALRVGLPSQLDRDLERELHRAEVDAGFGSDARDVPAAAVKRAADKHVRTAELAEHDARCQAELAALFDKDMSWGQIRDEVKRLITSDRNVKRLGGQRVTIHSSSIIDRALEEPTLVQALSLVALFDTENAVHQAMRNTPEDIRDTSHGGLWETFSLGYMRQLLEKWGISPECPRGAPARVHDPQGVWSAVTHYVTGQPKTPPVAPVPMLLSCPVCHTRHYDEGEFATKPHHTHACQGYVEVEGKRRRCGHVWRPALVPTVGVEALPGFINEPSDG